MTICLDDDGAKMSRIDASNLYVVHMTAFILFLIWMLEDDLRELDEHLALP